MNCPSCKVPLEIFFKDGKQIRICPVCFSALIADVSQINILKKYTTQELLSHLLSALVNDSIYDKKKFFQAKKDLACPACGSYMRAYNFNNKTKFNVNKCISCESIWLEKLQIPLIAISHLSNSEDDTGFKQLIENLYAQMSKKGSFKIRPLDELIAPYIAIPLSFLPIFPYAGAFPAGDDMVKTHKPYVILSIIGLCLFFFILTIVYGEPIIQNLSLIINQVYNNNHMYRLLTYMFLHGSIFHLLGNMWFLWIFGKIVEDRLGKWLFAILFFISGLSSAMLYSATAANINIPCVGASGAISGIIGCYLILFPKIKIKFNMFFMYFTKKITTYVPAYYYILTWIVINVLHGFIQAGTKTSDVAFWGHVGGFISGVIFAELYKNLKQA